MAEYIDKSALYEKIAQLEELARNWCLETPSNDPCYSRYIAQLNERTNFKHIIADFQAADVAPVRHGRWKYFRKQNIAVCTNCSFERDLDANFGQAIACPNCGAKME